MINRYYYYTYCYITIIIIIIIIIINLLVARTFGCSATRAIFHLAFSSRRPTKPRVGQKELLLLPTALSELHK